MGTPLTLYAVVDKGAMLNVGNANLTYLSYDMCFNPNLRLGDSSASYTEQGSWTSVTPDGCGENPPVTVNANIVAINWGSGPSSGPSWNWQDLQQAFATALGAVMQHVASQTAYANYSYTEVPWGKTGRVACKDPKFLDWGHYIPAAIKITAHDNNTGDQAAEITVTYSTDQSGGDGGDVCHTISDLVGGLLPLVLDDPVAAVIDTAMTVICDLIGG
jgi:hypothetical protein